MKIENNEYIQLPPLRRDTDLKVIIALWEYVKLPEEMRKNVLSFFNETNNNPSGDFPPLEYLESLPEEDIGDFDKVMGMIIKDIIVEASYLACWVYVCKFVDGLTLEQTLDLKRNAEQFIVPLYLMFDKYIVRSDDNNISPS